MNFYQEITLLPDAEASVYFLWKKIFQQIHLALVSIKNADEKVSVGISFPEYEESSEVSKSQLGSKLRLFAINKEDLEKIDLDKYLSRFSDYLHKTGIRPVPVARISEYAAFSRWRNDISPERLARRRMKRHNETFEQAMAYYKNFKAKNTPPFIQAKSLSGDREFRMFIVMKKVKVPVNGMFNCYGLSDQGTTVPIF